MPLIPLSRFPVSTLSVYPPALTPSPALTDRQVTLFNRAPRRHFARVHAPGPVLLREHHGEPANSAWQFAREHIHVVLTPGADGTEPVLAVQTFGLSAATVAANPANHSAIDLERGAMRLNKRAEPGEWLAYQNRIGARRTYYRDTGKADALPKTDPGPALPAFFVPGAPSSWPELTRWATHHRATLTAFDRASLTTGLSVITLSHPPAVVPVQRPVDLGAVPLSHRANHIAPLCLVRADTGTWSVGSADPQSLKHHLHGLYSMAVRAIDPPSIHGPTNPAEARVWVEKWLWWLENHSRAFSACLEGV